MIRHAQPSATIPLGIAMVGSSFFGVPVLLARDAQIHRPSGSGARWEATLRLFELACRRLGLNRTDGPRRTDADPRPRQGELFARD